MGFKSWMQPCAEVRRTMSGRGCLLFEAKARFTARYAQGAKAAESESF
jgi:hypothetical protein